MSAKTEADVRQIKKMIEILKNEIAEIRAAIEVLREKTYMGGSAYGKTLKLPKDRKESKRHA